MTLEERAEAIVHCADLERHNQGFRDRVRYEAQHQLSQARAEALQEAARAAYGSNHPVHSQWANGYSDGRRDASAAIRSLKGDRP